VRTVSSFERLPKPAPARDALLARMRRSCARLGKVQRLYTALVSEMHSFYDRAEQLEEELARIINEINEPAARLDPALCGFRDPELGRATVKACVSIQFDRHARRRVAVRLDHGESLVLPPVLGELLKILAKDLGGHAEDDLVGWKSLDQLRDLLAVETGRLHSRRALVENVYRLRKAFAAADLDAALLQTNPRMRAYRLAVRRFAVSR